LKENSEMIKNEEDIDFTEFGEDVTETELDQIKNAMIESLKEFDFLFLLKSVK
jgi:hypothetical protein